MFSIKFVFSRKLNFLRNIFVLQLFSMENLIFCQEETNPQTETFAANPQYFFFQPIAFQVLSFVKKLTFSRDAFGFVLRDWDYITLIPFNVFIMSHLICLFSKVNNFKLFSLPSRNFFMAPVFLITVHFCSIFLVMLCPVQHTTLAR